MNLWIGLYFGLFLAVTASGLVNGFQDHTPRLHLAACAVSDVTISYLFLAFWYPALRPPFIIAAPAFIAALCWSIFDIVEDIRTLPLNRNLSEARLRVMGALTLVTLLLVNGPAFAIAGITAFRS